MNADLTDLGVVLAIRVGIQSGYVVVDPGSKTVQTIGGDIFNTAARLQSPPALERLSQAAQWIEVQAGDVVVRQGDLGDAFYVIDQGRMSVAVGGVLREHLLDPGEGFGEIALLRDIPRTATVTAVGPCRLLRLERADFLAAITGSVDGRRIAAGVAAAHLDRDARPRGR